jgi:protein lifeguard
MGKKKDHCCHDAEVCYPLAFATASPYLIESPQMRWAFIRKVYAIVAMQLLLTVAVAATVNLVDPIRAFFQARTKEAVFALVVIVISPIIGKIL